MKIKQHHTQNERTKMQPHAGCILNHVYCRNRIGSETLMEDHLSQLQTTVDSS